MLAWLDAVEAEVETRFGNTRKALQLIHHAEDIFATGEPRPSPAMAGLVLAGTPRRIQGKHAADRAAARTRAGHPARCPRPPAGGISKTALVILGDLAAVAVGENDPERACALAEEALDHLARYWYATGMDRVRAVRESLTQWESLPCVRRLDERLYDWNTTVNALTG